MKLLILAVFLVGLTNCTKDEAAAENLRNTCLIDPVVCQNWQMEVWLMLILLSMFFLEIWSLTSNVVNILFLPAMTSVFVWKWISAWHIYDLRAFYLSPCFAPIRDKAFHLNEYWVNITNGTKDQSVACCKKCNRALFRAIKIAPKSRNHPMQKRAFI